MTDLDLWYSKPAAVWTEALPIGNGRLGAMVYGDISRERLALNEAPFYSGGPYQPINPDALGHLEQVRALIFAGQYAAAEAVAHDHMMAKPYVQTSYQPIGDVWITLHHPMMNATGYRRSLDLDRAVAQAMAQAHYGARGRVLHHNTDLWRATGPVDGPQWGLWPMGGAWLCAQLWDHVQFAGDDALRARACPLMKGAAEFLLDYLVVQPGTDYLVTCPSLSPENSHPFGSSLCAGPAMDGQIMRDLFDGVIDAANHLEVDAAFRDRVLAARKRLRPDRIGAAGQLQEWAEDWDLDVPEPLHRHVSHLYGIYPSLQIDLDRSPDLAAAARISLDLRDDEATGWGIGWRLNLWARLRDGKRAADVLTRLLSPIAPIPTCLMPIHRSRLTATLAARQGFWRCWCNRKTARSCCCPPCRPTGPTVPPKASAPEEG